MRYQTAPQPGSPNGDAGHSVSRHARLSSRRHGLAAHAGVAQWQSPSLPSWSCGFDSRHPLVRGCLLLAGSARLAHSPCLAGVQPPHPARRASPPDPHWRVGPHAALRCSLWSPAAVLLLTLSGWTPSSVSAVDQVSWRTITSGSALSARLVHTGYKMDGICLDCALKVFEQFLCVLG